MMKIRRLIALILICAGIISMVACGSNSKTDVSSDTVVDAFEELIDELNKTYSFETNMVLKMTSGELNISTDTNTLSSSYEGVRYTKTNSDVDSMGVKEKATIEQYVIHNDDGTVTTATKSTEDDEWWVYTGQAEDEETETDTGLDIESIKKSATKKIKGDECFVTMKIDIDNAALYEDEQLENMTKLTIDVIVTYNIKDKAITSFKLDVDIEEVEKMYEALGEGELEVEEFMYEIINIKKNEKAIEVPADIKLD